MLWISLSTVLATFHKFVCIMPSFFFSSKYLKYFLFFFSPLIYRLFRNVLSFLKFWHLKKSLFLIYNLISLVLKFFMILFLLYLWMYKVHSWFTLVSASCTLYKNMFCCCWLQWSVLLVWASWLIVLLKAVFSLILCLLALWTVERARLESPSVIVFVSSRSFIRFLL